MESAEFHVFVLSVHSFSEYYGERVHVDRDCCGPTSSYLESIYVSNYASISRLLVGHAISGVLRVSTLRRLDSNFHTDEERCTVQAAAVL